MTHNVERSKWVSFLPGVSKTKAPKYQVLEGEKLLNTEENNDHSEDVRKATAKKPKGSSDSLESFSETELKAAKLLGKGAENRWVADKLTNAALITAFTIVGTPVGIILITAAGGFDNLGLWQQEKAGLLMAKEDRAKVKKEVLGEKGKKPLPTEIKEKMELLEKQIKANKTLSEAQKKAILRPFLKKSEPKAKDVKELKKAYTNELKDQHRANLVKKMKKVRYSE